MNTRDVVDPPDATCEVSERADTAKSARAPTLEDPTTRCEASAELRQRVEGGRDPRPFKVDRDELARFDLKRAGLPDMSIEAAAKYVEKHRASRPWLAMTDGASPEARRIIAAMDAAGGHARIRHEGWVSEEANRRRVAYREDPAQLDAEKIPEPRAAPVPTFEGGEIVLAFTRNEAEQRYGVATMFARSA